MFVDVYVCLSVFSLSCAPLSLLDKFPTVTVCLGTFCGCRYRGLSALVKELKEWVHAYHIALSGALSDLEMTTDKYQRIQGDVERTRSERFIASNSLEKTQHELLQLRADVKLLREQLDAVQMVGLRMSCLQWLFSFLWISLLRSLFLLFLLSSPSSHCFSVIFPILVSAPVLVVVVLVHVLVLVPLPVLVLLLVVGRCCFGTPPWVTCCVKFA